MPSPCDCSRNRKAPVEAVFSFSIRTLFHTTMRSFMEHALHSPSDTTTERERAKHGEKENTFIPQRELCALRDPASSMLRTKMSTASCSVAQSLRKKDDVLKNCKERRQETGFVQQREVEMHCARLTPKLCMHGISSHLNLIFYSSLPSRPRILSPFELFVCASSLRTELPILKPAY